MDKKKTILILGMFGIIFMFFGGSLAYWTWTTSSEQQTNVAFTVEKDFECAADGGGNITSEQVSLIPTDCTNSTYAIKREVTVTPSVYKDELIIYMDLWLDVNEIGSGLSASNNFNYALTTSETSCTEGVVSSGNFKGIAAEDTVNLLGKNYYATSLPETYYLYIWLDSAETSSSTMNQTFDLSLNGSCVNNSPDAAAITSTSTLVKTSQTATLKMSDLEGVTSYYFGTEENPSDDDYTTITTTTSQTVTKTVSSAGTYYLYAKDTLGNVTKDSITYNSYTVNTMLQDVTGTQGEYETDYSLYDTTAYIAPTGTDLSTITSNPLTGTSYVGLNIGEPSASDITSTPTLSTLEDNDDVYTMWYDRKEYTVYVNGTAYGTTIVTSTNNSTGVTVADESTSTFTALYGETLTVVEEDSIEDDYSFGTFYIFGMTDGGQIRTTSASGNVKEDVYINVFYVSSTLTVTSIWQPKLNGNYGYKQTTCPVYLVCSHKNGIDGSDFGTLSNVATISPTTPILFSPRTFSVGAFTQLTCRDRNGIIATNVVPVQSCTSYKVYIMRAKTGAPTFYSTNMYDIVGTYTYYAPAGTVITPEKIWTIPNYSSESLFKAMSLGTPSTSSATAVSSYTVSSSSSNVIALWFGRAS